MVYAVLLEMPYTAICRGIGGAWAMYGTVGRYSSRSRLRIGHAHALWPYTRRVRWGLLFDPGAKKRFRGKGPIGASRAPFVLRLRLPARIRPFQGSQASNGTLGDI